MSAAARLSSPHNRFSLGLKCYSEKRGKFQEMVKFGTNWHQEHTYQLSKSLSYLKVFAIAFQSICFPSLSCIFVARPASPDVRNYSLLHPLNVCIRGCMIWILDDQIALPFAVEVGAGNVDSGNDEVSRAQAQTPNSMLHVCEMVISSWKLVGFTS
jgi:hypothetical protein